MAGPSLRGVPVVDTSLVLFAEGAGGGYWLRCDSERFCRPPEGCSIQSLSPMAASSSASGLSRDQLGFRSGPNLNPKPETYKPNPKSQLWVGQGVAGESTHNEVEGLD